MQTINFEKKHSTSMLLNALRKKCVNFSFLQSRNTKLVSLNEGKIASNEDAAKMYLSNILCCIVPFYATVIKMV